MDQTIADLLREPFPPESIGTKPSITCRACAHRSAVCDVHEVVYCGDCGRDITTAHVHVDFVGHAYVRERFCDVDADWTWRPMALNAQGLPALDDIGGLWILLTLGGKTLPGYGDAPSNSGGNAVKEAIGDALRNAGQSFGVALDLWKRAPGLPDLSLSDPSERQVARSAKTTAEVRAGELRAQIAAIGSRRGKDLAEVAGDFLIFSRGTDLTRASVARLVEYKDHLQQVTA
jgi:hypothetical protein